MLTDERKERILNALRAGAYRNTAAQHAGISERTLYNWINRGEEATKGIYFQFLQELQKVEADAELGNLAIISTAAPKQWQAAAWLLERRYPGKYGRQRIEVTGEDGAPIKTEEVGLSDTERLQRLLELLDTARARRDGQLTNGGAADMAPDGGRG